MKTLCIAGTLALMLSGNALSQTAEAYGESGETAATSLLDPSRFDIRHAVSFGASGGSLSSIRSQSLYATMIQYEFAKPVTLNLNFGLPIHSTYHNSHNLSTETIQSLDYLRDMPWDVSLSWHPRENLLMRFSVVRNTVSSYHDSPFASRSWWTPYRTRNDMFRD